MTYTFNRILNSMSSEALRPLARAWTGKGLALKEERLVAVASGLADPLAVQRMVSSLLTNEKQLLHLLALTGGQAPTLTVALAALAYGVDVPDPGSLKSLGGVLDAIVVSGVALAWATDTILTDHRITDVMGDVVLPELPLCGVKAGMVTVSRRQQAVSLDLMAAAGHFQRGSSIGVTKTGSLKALDLRRLGTVLGWEGDAPFDGLPFPHASHALVWALRASGLMTTSEGKLRATEAFSQLVASDHVGLVRRLAMAFVQTPGWRELQLRDWDPDGEARAMASARGALVLLLRALPCRAGMHCALLALSDLLRGRVGRYFSVNPRACPRAPFMYTPQVDVNWSMYDHPWLVSCLSTWMYALGLVELSLVDGHPVSFGLTDLGSQVFIGDAPSEGAATASVGTSGARDQSPWAVLPNFEVVAYLGFASIEQLRFLEEHADRLDLQEHTARYGLTRASVYRGLQAGSQPSAFLDSLMQGSSHELPPNVVTELKEWTRAFSRITLCRDAVLVWPDGQDPTHVARAEFAKTSVEGGARVRVLELSDPPRTLSVDEDGLVQLQSVADDPLAALVLGAWSERQTPNSWRLTRESVALGAAKGSAGEMLAFIAKRCAPPLPPIVALAVKAWAGIGGTQVDISRAVMLLCKSWEDFQALTSSRRLRPYIRDFMGDRTIVVSEDQLPALLKELEWAGIAVGPATTPHTRT